MDLNHLRAFAAIAETGGITAAALSLRVPKSLVSRSLAALEDDLGVRLVQRTTRRVSLTAEGSALYQRTAPSLRVLAASAAELGQIDEPSGVLRVTATIDIGAAVLGELLARLRARHPRVTVEARLTNAVVDLVGEGFDLALRLGTRPLRSSSLIARKLGAHTTQLYAAPAYLARRGTPRRPEELLDHELVELRGAPGLELRTGARTVRVRRQNRFVGDDMFFIRAALHAGAGIGFMPVLLGAADVAEGKLVRVLPRWTLPSATLYFVTPGGGPVPARVAAFRDLVVEAMH